MHVEQPNFEHGITLSEAELFGSPPRANKKHGLSPGSGGRKSALRTRTDGPVITMEKIEEMFIHPTRRVYIQLHFKLYILTKTMDTGHE